MAPLQALVEPSNVQPESSRDRSVPRRTLLINNFQFSSWLLAAAFLQGVLTWLFPSALTFIPALLILGYRAFDVLLIMYGFKPNPYLDGVIQQKFSAQVPDENGDFGDTPSQKTVVVLLLGSKSNHPLGILSPEFVKVGNFFAEMVLDLEANREEYTYLTSSSWISNSDPVRNAARETMTVFYFQSMDGLHRFAHGPAHRKGWDWWNRTVKEHPDISIMHEVYEAPAGHWENIFINYKPNGFATARFPLKTTNKGKEGQDVPKQWIGSIVDGSKMNMKSAKNRLGRSEN